jgi:hypothetical protein
MKLRDRLSDGHRIRNREKYLSRFECWLNRSLWVLLAITLLYTLFQHVILASRTEIFHGGALLGAISS